MFVVQREGTVSLELSPETQATVTARILEQETVTTRRFAIFIFTLVLLFLTKNKKISASVLMGATAIWVLFEWINVHFLSLVCYRLLLGMIVQFVWSNASGALNRSQSGVPRLVLPKDFFAEVGVTIGTDHRGLMFLQDLACRGSLKQFLMAAIGLWLAAMIGSCCNFLTVLYIGFVGAHTMPVLYEKYEDEVDGFVDSLLMKFHSHYKKMDTGFLSRIPSGRFGFKKHD
uniref:Reticulon-like protein n=1 Tax=Brassica oleracea var. oleracea TaxID=109376 RepID=A0A0D3AQ15_BRAOL